MLVIFNESQQDRIASVILETINPDKQLWFREEYKKHFDMGDGILTEFLIETLVTLTGGK